MSVDRYRGKGRRLAENHGADNKLHQRYHDLGLNESEFSLKSLLRELLLTLRFFISFAGELTVG